MMAYIYLQGVYNKYMKKSVKIKPKSSGVATLAPLKTAFGVITFSPTSVGTASISTVTDQEFIKQMKKASKEDLFSQPEKYGQPD